MAAEKGIFCVCIDVTGFGKDDKIVSIGVASAPLRSDVKLADIKTKLFAYDLGSTQFVQPYLLPTGEMCGEEQHWRMHWSTKNFDANAFYFQVYWAKRLEALNILQFSPDVRRFAQMDDMMDRLYYTLRELEDEHLDGLYMITTPGAPLSALDKAVASQQVINDWNSIYATCDGEVRATYDFHSFVRGIAKFSPLIDDTYVDTFILEHIHPLRLGIYEPDTMPHNRAANTLIDFIAATQYCENEIADLTTIFTENEK
jgi:hypothetical protein